MRELKNRHCRRGASLLLIAGAVAAFLMPAGSAAAAQPRSREAHAVVDSAGVLVGDFGSSRPSVSADGARIVFTSSSRALPSANGRAQLYLKDLIANTVVSLSVGFDALPADADVSSPVISSDGRYVVFTTSATNIVDRFEEHGVTQVYRTSVADPTKIEPVSVGNRSNIVGDVDVSADGEVVVFSTETNLSPALTPAGVAQVYARTMSVGYTYLISTAATPADSHAFSPSVSPDGRIVGFLSAASDFGVTTDSIVQAWTVDTGGWGATPQLVSSGRDGVRGNEPTSWIDVASDGAVALASRATNLAGDRLAPRTVRVYHRSASGAVTTLVSHDRSGAGVDAGGGSAQPQLSADGSRIVYLSSALHVGDIDGNGMWQAYSYEVSTDSSELITRSAADRPGDANSSSLALAADGGYVAYRTEATNLVSLLPGTDILLVHNID